MSFRLGGMSFAGIAAAVAIAILTAEFVGYVLHRVMHSGRFPALSRGHMIHHLELYGPTQSMRSAAYRRATDGRASLGNIVMEWVVPSAITLGACWGIMWAWHVAWKYEVLVLAILLGWPIFMFSYLHDRMHLEKFWTARAPLLKIWFRKARRLHDIHHRSLNDKGRMDRNHGIGFFFFDRLFGTMAKHHCPLNWHGYHAAKRRHRTSFESDDGLTDFPSGFRVWK
jgi:sterol desaturase/sphingolipid hydroxylase (fatty acid hydroxylase superfamily)